MKEKRPGLRSSRSMRLSLFVSCLSLPLSLSPSVIARCGATKESLSSARSTASIYRRDPVQSVFIFRNHLHSLHIFGDHAWIAFAVAYKQSADVVVESLDRLTSPSVLHFPTPLSSQPSRLGWPHRTSFASNHIWATHPSSSSFCLSASFASVLFFIRCCCCCTAPFQPVGLRLQ